LVSRRPGSYPYIEDKEKVSNVFEGRGAIGYDHGYDAQKFYLGLALDPN
jgi:hypothetical protein